MKQLVEGDPNLVETWELFIHRTMQEACYLNCSEEANRASKMFYKFLVKLQDKHGTAVVSLVMAAVTGHVMIKLIEKGHELEGSQTVQE